MKREIYKNMEPASSLVDPPHPKKSPMHSMKALCFLSPPEGQHWAVYTYVLNRDLETKGSEESCYGLFYILGTFSTREKALERAQHITRTTDQKMGVVKLGIWAPLQTSALPEEITWISEDTETKMAAWESQEFRRKQEAWERRKKWEKEVLEEKERALDADDPEYFHHQCVMAIFNDQRHQVLQKQEAKTRTKYQERVNKLRAHAKLHPERPQEWLSRVHERYQERQEEDLWDMLRSAYEKLQSEWFPPSEIEEKREVPSGEKSEEKREKDSQVGEYPEGSSEPGKSGGSETETETPSEDSSAREESTRTDAGGDSFRTDSRREDGGEEEPWIPVVPKHRRRRARSKKRWT